MSKNRLPHLIFCLLLAGGMICEISCQKAEKSSFVRVHTDKGDMVFRLFERTPHHRDHFLKMVQSAFFDSLLIHKVNAWVVQGGDPDSKYAPPGQLLGFGDNGESIAPEIGAPHFHGALAAVRSSDAYNPEKKSSGSQFFIVRGQLQTDEQLDAMEKKNHIRYSEEQRARYRVQGGNPSLDGQYTVFGELIEGSEVLDSLAALPTDRYDRPLQDIRTTIRKTERH